MLKYFKSYETIMDLMFESDYVQFKRDRLSPVKYTLSEEEFCSKRNDFIRSHLLHMSMNASLISVLCHYVLWVYDCSTVREYEERVKEVADSMNIGRIVFVSGFDNIKQLVWEKRLDDHLHYFPVFDRVEQQPFETMASLPSESSCATPPPFSMNL